MRLIGIKLGNADSFIRKTLRENTWYPFGKYQEPSSNNRWEWRVSPEPHNELPLHKVYQLMADDPNESLEITVNCIVGMNGSGKSTLLDILYRIINNFSHRLIDEAWVENTPEKNPQRGHYLSFAKKFEATLFFETDGVVGSIHNCYDNIFFSYHSNSKDANFNKFKIEGPISNTKIEQITRHLFYTICTNYSIHSLNELDYTPNPLWLEYRDSKIDGKWISGLFHKNDGYVVPITMIPFRDSEGRININNENELAKQRLGTLALLFASQKKPFLSDYQATNIKYRFDFNAKDRFNNKFKKLFNESFPLNKQAGKLKKALTNSWKDYLIESLTNEYADLSKDVKATILSYLTYKTLKICIQYRKYGVLLGINNGQDKKDLNKESTYLSLDWNEDTVQNVIKEILVQEPGIHVNQKIHQVLNFIKIKNYLTDNIFIPAEAKNIKDQIKRDSAFGWSETPISLLFPSASDNADIKTSFKTYDEAYLNMPPAFFEWDIVLSKGIGGSQETLSQLSSGERQLLHSLSYIVYHIKNIESVKNGNYRLKYHNISLIFDEAELYYHPDYQKRFVGTLIQMLSWCHINHNIIRGVNILIVTHSPFVLSDIPLEHTLYLKNGDVINKSKETFCGNIHEMLGENFFMEYSIGDVAKENVEEIIRLYNQIDKKDKQEDNKHQYLKNKTKFDYVCSIIADDYLRNKVEYMLQELSQKYVEEDIVSLDKEISEMREKLEKLEYKRHLLNNK